MSSPQNLSTRNTSTRPIYLSTRGTISHHFVSVNYNSLISCKISSNSQSCSVVQSIVDASILRKLSSSRRCDSWLIFTSNAAYDSESLMFVLVGYNSVEGCRRNPIDSHPPIALREEDDASGQIEDDEDCWKYFVVHIALANLSLSDIPPADSRFLISPIIRLASALVMSVLIPLDWRNMAWPIVQSPWLSRL